MVSREALRECCIGFKTQAPSDGTEEETPGDPITLPTGVVTQEGLDSPRRSPICTRHPPKLFQHLGALPEGAGGGARPGARRQGSWGLGQATPLLAHLKEAEYVCPCQP